MQLTIEIRRTFSDVNTFARFAAAVKMLESEFGADAEPIGGTAAPFVPNGAPFYVPRPAPMPSQAVQAAARYEAAAVEIPEVDPFAPAGDVPTTDTPATAVAAPAGGDGGDVPKKRGRKSAAEKEAIAAAQNAMLQEAATASAPAPAAPSAPPLQAPPAAKPAAPVAPMTLPPAIADNALAMAMARLLQAKMQAQIPDLLKHFGVTGMSQLPKERHPEAVNYIDGLIALGAA